MKFLFQKNLFVEDIEYKNFADFKDLVDLSLEKFEPYLSENNNKSRLEEMKN